ncbi:hypothetical protein Q4543_17785 [Salipiger sp. 1_MG-2023]|uniref:hypothetical protein n=1 Tax=Salipiger sp. 1_MG-2023 TaxID=3062665 RepID=UPI0026E20EED|nr:hypothetical protein [Salipiger sp. 1_MG-2023]MDO6587367.1 hypothetical protein [Salipiger sp. 1_MG-2023]
MTDTTDIPRTAEALHTEPPVISYQSGDRVRAWLRGEDTFALHAEIERRHGISTTPNRRAGGAVIAMVGIAWGLAIAGIVWIA